MKHSGARSAEVRASVDGGFLRVGVRDDGAGGAKPGRGAGLIGLRDRVEALGGTIVVVSPEGRRDVAADRHSRQPRLRAGPVSRSAG